MKISNSDIISMIDSEIFNINKEMHHNKIKNKLKNKYNVRNVSLGSIVNKNY